MFTNRAKDKLNNITGKKIADLRKSRIPKLSQRQFADLLQQHGLDLDKNAIQRIESRQRFVTDIELYVISKVLNVDLIDLMDLEQVNY